LVEEDVDAEALPFQFKRNYVIDYGPDDPFQCKREVLRKPDILKGWSASRTQGLA
jgi:hypothetical protein